MISCIIYVNFLPSYNYHVYFNNDLNGVTNNYYYLLDG